jgi:Fuc2NAc and GlcNAc transferase
MMAAIVAGSLLIACSVTFFMRRWAVPLGFVDVPNARSSHISPTARGGGVAIVSAFFSGVLLLTAFHLLYARIAEALIICGGAVALIGFIDDKRPVSARVRFAVHAAAAICAIFLMGWSNGNLFAFLGAQSRWLGPTLTAIALVWTVNLFNFMDGIDGIAGSEALFFVSAGALLNWFLGGNSGISASMLCLGAACLGFLFFNWPPASIFMGDVGSGFLGITLLILAIGASQTASLSLGIWPILGGAFLVDATITLVRRMARGDRWHEAHRSHAYQHLSRRLGSHQRVTLIVTAINVFWLFPWAWFLATHPASALLCLLGALSPLIAGVLLLGAGKPRH